MHLSKSAYAEEQAMRAALPLRTAGLGLRAALIGGLSLFLGSVVAPAHGSQFQLFDALLFKNAPALSQFGFKHVRVTDDLWVAKGDTSQPPTDAGIRKALSFVGNSAYFVLDIEQWTMTGNAQKILQSREKYLQTLDLVRRAGPGVKLGFYSVVPESDYWRAIKDQNSAAYKDWQNDNNLAAPIAAKVDALFVSLYTFYSDEDGWVKVAVANLREARRLANGKPVYCFLWPQYHDNYQLIPGEYWSRQLDTCHKYADGIVIWGGFTPAGGFTPLAWNDNAPWWRATLAFVKALQR
jgi:hypothetical protein